jgi:2-methylisocitrate lyase-like PEP mutase family enzyme
LHESGCFVIPNPWDRGSARALEQLGFKALASTSAGFAFSRGLPDAPDALSVEDVLEHVGELARGVEIPLNADFQAGYAEDEEGIARNVNRCIDAGVAGLSLEDVRQTPQGGLFALPEAVARIAAAREAIDASASGVLLTARAECFLVGHPDPLRESIRRLQAYAQAGADVLFAPGLRDIEDIRAIVDAVAPKPVNVLIGSNLPLRVEDLAALGVRRISVGSGLARAAWGQFLRAARLLAADGSFSGLDGAAEFGLLNGMFAGPGI